MATSTYRLQPLRVNVDVKGYTSKDLGSNANKNSIIFLLKKYGLNVYSVSVSKSSSTGITYISIVINAQTNTVAELEKIKQQVNAVMTSILPLGKDDITASFAGAAANSVITSPAVRDTSTFAFQMIGVGSQLSARHAQFNQAFVKAFPKLLYTNPSTSFTEPIGIASIGGESQIHAVGDTRATPEITKTVILNLLRNANIPISSNIIFSQRTIQELQSGATLTPPVNTSFVYNDKNYTAPINTLHIPGISYGLPDFSNLKLPDLPNIASGSTEKLLETIGNGLGLDSLAKSLGLVAGTATITAVVVGGVFLLVMLKK